MSSQNSEAGSADDADVFDIDRVRQLVELMKEFELTEIDLRQSSRRIRLRSGHEPAYVSMPAPAAALAPAGPARATVDSEAPVADDENAALVKSPMVGTFYTASKPGEPAFVKIGDHVQADTIVCIIEAMKMFNEIPAGVSGKIVSMLVKNEEPVDVGRPLFKVIPD